MIKLANVQPIPLKDDDVFQDSEIWATECVFEPQKNYLIAAPSGKGKSTLLHIIYGLRHDFDGLVEIDKENSKSLTLDQWSQLRQDQFSIVFQDLRLFLQLTARENIELNALLAGPGTVLNIDDMARKLGVRTLLNKPCHTLSYGQRQRIAIIRALSQPFKYLLLDEPFSHLDEANVQVASDLIEEVCRLNNAGLILVSLGEPFLFQYDEKMKL